MATRARPCLAAAAALMFTVLLAGPAGAQGPRDGAAILLVADPELSDPNFRHSVVLVSGHRGVAGPIGVIINRPTTVTLARALPDVKALSGLDDKVYFGGPVSTQALFYVFRSPPQSR